MPLKEAIDAKNSFQVTILIKVPKFVVKYEIKDRYHIIFLMRMVK